MQTGLSSHAMGHCKLKPGYFDFTHAKRHPTQKYTYMTTNHDINKKYVCTLTRVSSVVLAGTSQTKRIPHPQPSMLCPPSCSSTIKGEIQTDDCRYPRIPLASFPGIEGSQQCYSTGCGGVLVAAAAVVVVADRQWKRLRCHVRWRRSSRRLARPDCPPKWCSRGSSTAGRRCRLRYSVQ